MNPFGKEKRVMVAIPNDSGFGAPLLSGISAFAQRSGSWAIRLVSDDADLPMMARQMQPDGAILSPSRQPVWPDLVLGSGTPTVFVSTGIEKANSHPVFLCDDLAIGKLGADHLLETQAVSFGFVGYHWLPFSAARKRGFVERLGPRKHRLVYEFESIDPSRFALDPVRFGALEEAFADWLLTLPRPTAIMAADDRLASAIVALSRQMEIRIPEELTIVGVDNSARYCETILPALSSIRLPLEEMGWEAARVLDEWMFGTVPTPGIRCLSNNELVKRRSSTLSRVKDPLVSKAIDFIERKIDHPFSVGEMEQELGVSRRALELHFRRSIGRTPLMEIRRQRVEHAKKLLIETTESIHRIAGRCGFNSTTRFCIVFKEFTDLRPSEYRTSINPAMRLRPVSKTRPGRPERFGKDLSNIINIEEFELLPKRMAKSG